MSADDLSCGSGLTDAGYSVQDHPDLVAQGWVRRFMAAPERAREATELYEAMGFEVMAVELT